MLFGISTACTYPEHTEIAVKKLCESGVSNIEIFFNSACETQGKIFDEIVRIVKANGTNVTSIHPFTSSFEPFMLFSDYDRRFSDGREYLNRYYDCAGALGADIVVLHGDRADRLNHDDRYIERYHKLYTAAREKGVYLAQENVSRCRSKDLEFIRKMKAQLLGDVRFVLDFKQARRSEVSFKDLADAMGDKIIHLHINDYDDSHDCLLAGQGVCDFNAALLYLAQKGFNGSGVIEVYRQNYGDFKELVESLKFLNKTVKI